MTMQEAVNLLLRRVPEFASERSSDTSFLSYNDDSPYLVFGDLARFLVNRVKQEPTNSEIEALLTKSFGLLSDMATSAEDSIVNLAQVGVFEVLTDSPEAVLAARQHLSGKAADVFEDVVDLWAPKQKLSEE